MFIRIMLYIWVGLNVLVIAGLVTSSYAGYLNPLEWGGAGVMAMTQPLWAGVAILMLVFDLIWWRKTAIVTSIGILCCAGPLWNLCPLNLPHRSLSVEQKARSFTLLTYNVYTMVDLANKDGEPNHTMDYILESDADIVCLQELYVLMRSDVTHITDDQLKRLHRRYPYIIMSGYSQAIFSKYPVKALPVNYKRPDANGGDFAAYQLEIDGQQFTIFNCHFQSIGLTSADKALYSSLTDLKGNRSTLGTVRHQLISKLSHANQRRASQAEMVGRYIKHYGGPNVIVCGDFNDVPGCYTLRRLEEFNLKEVYPEVGFGPMITYNANRFYFRIDHVLYRGDFHPVSIKRGSTPSSDHYPLLTTFVFNK